MLTIHVSDEKMEEFLSAEAVKRSCLPEQVALALILCAADGNLADAILDDFRPSAIPETKPRRRSVQIRVMRSLPEFQAPNGTIVASVTDISRHLATDNRGCVRNAIHALVRKHLLDVVFVGSAGMPSRYRLTEAGNNFLQELGK